jgi:sigma-54-specific transcriptional regulator
MELLSHNFPADFIRSVNIAKGNPDQVESLIAFDDAERLSLLIRATAIVFSDPRSKELHQLIERIAPSDATVMITGETGTGKELVARHVHALSRRADRPFVAINCGAFAETLIESELFGYEKGAYTGALQGKPGWFETASGGTLFLDEIGDLPLPMQVKLLRVLQEREVIRLGARRPIPIDVRVIAATNVDLSEAVRAGRFREDLFYRLQVIALPLPPLRERPGDILPLTQHFLQIYAKRLHVQKTGLHPDAELALINYPWPGNIRELENVIHRALLVCSGALLQVRDLHLPGWIFTESATTDVTIQANKTDAVGDSVVAVTTVLSAWQALLNTEEVIDFEQLQQELVAAAWHHRQCNQVQAAKQLNISRNTLRTYLKKSQLI